MKKLALLIVLLASGLLSAQTPTVITTTSSSGPAGCATIDVSDNKGAVGFVVTGTWTGTLQPEVQIANQAPANSYVIPSTGTTTQTTVTANGTYFFPSSAVAGANTALVCGPTSTGSANVYMVTSFALNILPGSGGGGGAVTSVFGRTGAVVATGGDYTCAQVTNCTATPAFSVITSGTNTTAAMVVGTGGSLTTSGSGTIVATSCPSCTPTGAAGGVLSGTYPNPGLSATPTVPNTVTFSPTSGSVLIFTVPSSTEFELSSGGDSVTIEPGLTGIQDASSDACSFVLATGVSCFASGGASLQLLGTNVTLNSSVVLSGAGVLSGLTGLSSSGTVSLTGTTKITTLEPSSGHVLCSSTAPTISSGFGTGASISHNNGTCSFTINVGTGGSATTGVIGFPAATTGWVVSCNDITTQSATVQVTKQTSSTNSTTAASIGNFTDLGVAGAWAASDVLNCTAFGY